MASTKVPVLVIKTEICILKELLLLKVFTVIKHSLLLQPVTYFNSLPTQNDWSLSGYADSDDPN